MNYLELHYMNIKKNNMHFYKKYDANIDWDVATKDFEKLAKGNYPCKLCYRDAKTPVPVLLNASNWPIDDEVQVAEDEFKANLKLKLANILQESELKAILTMKGEDIRNAVISKNIEAFTALKDVDDVAANRVIESLYGKVTFGAVVIGNSRKHFHERVRATLNPDFGWVANAPFWKFDTVKKRWSHLENYAAALSGDENCIIGCISTIRELSASSYDVKARDIANIKLMYWESVCENGLVLNGRRYIVFAHGTNAAKDNNTLWCREEYVDEVRKEFVRHTDPDWQLTDAKHVAYLYGLQAVYAEPTLLPIEPQDFVFCKSLEQDLIDRVAFNHTDGTTTFIENGTVRQNQFDGQLIFHVSEKMKKVFVTRLMAKGYNEEEAKRIIENELAKMVGHSMRTDNAAMKGVAVVDFDIHSYYHDEGVKTIQGIDVDDIVCFCDETVLKTPIGEGKAYRTREDWINAVKDGFQYKILLKAHEFKKKDIPYQVIQSCHKANPETVREFAREQAKKLNGLFEMKNAVKLLSPEQRALLKAYPEAVNHWYFQEKLNQAYNTEMDTAFAGKRTGEAYIALLYADAIAFAQHIAGLEVTGCQNAGDVYCPTMRSSEIAFWRNPVLDTGSLRVMNLRSRIISKYAKYFNDKSTMMMMNIKDTTITRVRGDYDGDKGGFSFNKWLIKMFKESHENFGDYLSDWAPLKGEKHVITKETQKEYFKRLCYESNLGKTCAGLNRLYNGIRYDEKKKAIVFFEATYGEVANSTARANNLVDASKHGSQAFAETETIAAKLDGAFQPQAKQYRDMVDKNGKLLSLHVNRKEALKYLEQIQKKIENTTDAETRKGLEETITNLKPIMELEKLAKVPENYRRNTLNIYMGELSDTVERFYELKDKPEGKFNVQNILFDKEGKRRRLDGFIRRGRIYIKELGYRLDEGLFNSIARRTARDWELIKDEDNDTKDRNVSVDDYNAEIRLAALAEIDEFARMSGKDIKDAFDYATWWFFSRSDTEYDRTNPVEKVLLDQIGRAYWTIFGGMLKDAVRESTKEIDPNSITDEQLKID